MASMEGSGDRSQACFIVLDGIDGCGKSTQARELVGWLTKRGGEVLHVREPGTTALGEALRELLLARGPELSSGVETLLFAAARRQMLDEVVGPALARGAHVVCERFHASTFAYQAFAADEAEEEVLNLLRTFAGTPAPDLTIVLRVDPRVASARRGSPGDRIEDRGLDFQIRVAEGFERYAELSPEVVMVDADAAPAEVAGRIREEFERVGA